MLGFNKQSFPEDVKFISKGLFTMTMLIRDYDFVRGEKTFSPPHHAPKTNKQINKQTTKQRTNPPNLDIFTTNARGKVERRGGGGGNILRNGQSGLGATCFERWKERSWGYMF